MTHEEAWGELRARVAAADPITEIHIVNGLHPGLPFDYYTELLRGPEAHPAAASTSRRSPPSRSSTSPRSSGCPYAEVLARLRAAGPRLAPGRRRRDLRAARAQEDLRRQVHAATSGWTSTAPRTGSGCARTARCSTGTIETVEERVDHMLRLRALQDETGGFQTFIPLAFHPENNALMKLPGPTGVEDLRTYAVARLMLDNIPHIKAYWIMLGVKTAQTALWFGADDLDGTVQEERIYHMAGAETPQAMSPAEIVRIIRDAGRTPVERDTLYNVVAEGAALASDKPFRRDVRREPGGRVVSEAAHRRRVVPERAADHLRPRARPGRRSLRAVVRAAVALRRAARARRRRPGPDPQRQLRRRVGRAAHRPRASRSPASARCAPCCWSARCRGQR